MLKNDEKIAILKVLLSDFQQRIDVFWGIDCPTVTKAWMLEKIHVLENVITTGDES